MNKLSFFIGILGLVFGVLGLGFVILALFYSEYILWFFVCEIIGSCLIALMNLLNLMTTKDVKKI